MKDFEASKHKPLAKPETIRDTLTPKEQKELAEAIDKAIEAAQKHAQEEEAGGDGFPIDTDAFSPELTEKMKQYLDSLPEKKKQELKYKAYKALREFGEDIADDIGGQLSDNPTKAAARREQGERMPDAPSDAPPEKQEDTGAAAERAETATSPERVVVETLKILNYNTCFGLKANAPWSAYTATWKIMHERKDPEEILKKSDFNAVYKEIRERNIGVVILNEILDDLQTPEIINSLKKMDLAISILAIQGITRNLSVFQQSLQQNKKVSSWNTV